MIGSLCPCLVFVCILPPDSGFRRNDEQRERWDRKGDGLEARPRLEITGTDLNPSPFTAFRVGRDSRDGRCDRCKVLFQEERLEFMTPLANNLSWMKAVPTISMTEIRNSGFRISAVWLNCRGVPDANSISQTGGCESPVTGND